MLYLLTTSCMVAAMVLVSSPTVSVVLPVCPPCLSVKVMPSTASVTVLLLRVSWMPLTLKTASVAAADCSPPVRVVGVFGSSTLPAVMPIRLPGVAPSLLVMSAMETTPLVVPVPVEFAVSTSW